jgi:hypothetical protein
MFLCVSVVVCRTDFVRICVRSSSICWGAQVEGERRFRCNRSEIVRCYCFVRFVFIVRQHSVWASKQRERCTQAVGKGRNTMQSETPFSPFTLDSFFLSMIREAKDLPKRPFAVSEGVGGGGKRDRTSRGADGASRRRCGTDIYVILSLSLSL